LRADYGTVAKLLELKSKLYGLLVDRVQVECVDLKGALLEPRTRVITIVDITPGHGKESVSAVRTLTAVRAPYSRSPVLDD
jgi:hypothetical protein